MHHGNLGLVKILRPRVLSVFRRSRGPIYLGHISNEIGYGLEHTAAAVDALIIDGILRCATQEELCHMGAVRDACVYVLCED